MMNNYITTIVVSANGTTTPNYIKLGNRSEQEKNQINFLVPLGTTNEMNKNQAIFKHESGKLFTVDGIYNDPDSVSVIVPVSVQSIPGYYTVEFRVINSEGSQVFISNQIKAFIVGDNSGITSMINVGTMSTIQSPTFGYLTVKGGILYTSTDGEDWRIVQEPYVTNTISNYEPSAVFEYGQLLIVDMENGLFGLKIGDGQTSFAELPWAVIPDVDDDKMYLRTKGKWKTSDELVQISDDGYWVVGGVKTNTPVIQPTFEIGTVEDAEEAEVTISGTPENVVFNFKLPRGYDSDTKVGELEYLETQDKSSVVAAINEIFVDLQSALSLPWSDVTNKPGISEKLDIVISETQPDNPAPGRTLLWIEGYMSE